MEPGHWICAGHAAFDRRLESMVAHARAGAWNDLHEAWEAFARDLADHMEYEEREIFEDFGHETSAHASALQALLDDHGDLRERLASIAAQIGDGAVEEATFDAFLVRLREHSEREDASVYAWLEQRRGRHMRTDRTL